jgi:hypothetical protein
MTWQLAEGMQRVNAIHEENNAPPKAPVAFAEEYEEMEEATEAEVAEQMQDAEEQGDLSTWRNGTRAQSSR